MSFKGIGNGAIQ